jgi:signal peptide peptidase SppA
MRYARLFSKLYAEPLMVTMPAWQSFDRALMQLMRGGSPVLPALGAMKQSLPLSDAIADRAAASPQSDFSKGERDRRVYEVRGDVALIYVSGVIDKHVSLFELDCYGGVDLDDIEAALKKAAADPNIRKIMMIGNSPGGSVIGVHECAMLFREIGQKKDTAYFSDSISASAMEYIGSQANERFCTYSSYWGSIGVYCALLDETQWMADNGLKVNLVKAGHFKAMGASFKPLEDDERALIQERTNKLYDMFVETIQSARPAVTIETCQGQCFVGDEIVKVGLADAVVRSLDDALAAF